MSDKNNNKLENGQIKFVGCRNCGSISTHPILRNAVGFKSLYLNICWDCGLIFDVRVPTEKELKSNYADYSYNTIKPLSLATRRSYQDVLNRFFKDADKGVVFDFGCGQGDFLVLARQAGFRVFGTEFSVDALNLCHKRGLKVFSNTEPLFDEQKISESSVDLFTAFEVLEHLGEPKAFFELAHTVLKPSGVLYLTSPNFNALSRFIERERSPIFGYPDHLCFYSKKWFIKNSKHFGFEVIDIKSQGLNIGSISRSPEAAIDLSTASRRSSSCIPDSTDWIRNFFASNLILKSFKGYINAGLNLFNVGETLKVTLRRI